MSEYPEHEKLKAVRHEADTVGRFLDWLSDNGYRLAKWQKFEEYRNEQLVETPSHPAALIGAFLDISEDRLESEKRAMLEGLRAAHAPAAPEPPTHAGAGEGGES